MTRKFFKKYVRIEKTSTFTKAFYIHDGEELFCGNYTKSWTVAEIKEDVVNELSRRFA